MPEYFQCAYTRIGRRIKQHGRRIASVRDFLAAAKEFRTCGNGFIDPCSDTINLGLSNERADLGFFVFGRSDSQLGRPIRKLRSKFGSIRSRGEHALHRYANLPGMIKTTLERCRQRRVTVIRWCKE